jgi:predicted transcriptional regulator
MEEITMGRMRENPRYNVISMRISDEEREHLENIMDQTHLSISDIMREAMDYFAANYVKIEAQRKVA